MKFEFLFNNIVDFGMLKENVEMFLDASDEDKATIEEAMVKYMVTFDTNLDNIQDQLVNHLKKKLTIKIQESIEEDAKMKEFSLEKIGSLLSQEDRHNI
jgi:TRAP-type C4-dicarboxylate transport system substrate-binding protein